MQCSFSSADEYMMTVNSPTVTNKLLYFNVCVLVRASTFGKKKNLNTVYVTYDTKLLVCLFIFILFIGAFLHQVVLIL